MRYLACAAAFVGACACGTYLVGIGQWWGGYPLIGLSLPLLLQLRNTP